MRSIVKILIPCFALVLWTSVPRAALQFCDAGAAGPVDGLFSAGWFHNVPAGTLKQDGFWATAPAGGAGSTLYHDTDGIGADTSVVASAANEAVGAGVVRTVAGTAVRLSGVTTTNSLAAAVAANDYLEYRFTTPPSIARVFVERVGYWRTVDATRYPFRWGIAISDDAFATSTTIVSGVLATSPAAADWQSAPTTAFPLLAPATTYALRVYFYDRQSSSGEIVWDDFQFGVAGCADWGDAPDDLSSIDASLANAYPTTAADNGAVHTVRAPLLGAAADVDADGQPTLAADGDDADGTDDEDGVSFPTLGGEAVLVAGTSNALSITASAAGRLDAWIDYNQDGDWIDPGEAIASNYALSPGVNALAVTPSLNAPTGVTYARFRISSSGGLAPTGGAADGEVEDHRVRLVLPAAADCQSTILNSGFETPVRGAVPHVQTWAEAFAVREADVLGWSFVASNPTDGSSFDERNAIEFVDAWPSYGAYEGAQCAELNAVVAGALYQDLALPPGVTVGWQVAHRARAGTDEMDVRIGPPSAPVSQGIYAATTAAWVVHSGSYTVPPGQAVTRFELRAHSTGSGSSTAGNRIDAVRLGVLCDFGDAAPAYPVLFGSGGAYHLTDGRRLGTTVDTEDDGLPHPGALGDDLDAATDDEDGILFTSGLVQGSAATLDVTASAAGFVNAWIDFNADGDWDDPGEKVLTDEAVSAGTTGTGFAVPPTALPGTTFARFRYTPAAGSAGAPTGPAAGGEVEDYAVTVAHATLALVKRAFQADGTPIPDGATLPRGVPVTFLLYVANPTTVASDVTLADVLDPTFAYQAGSMRADDSLAASAVCPGGVCDESAIFAQVDAAGTPLGDGDAVAPPIDTDVASYDSGSTTIRVGDGANPNNATLDLAPDRVWALRFIVRIQ